MRLYPNVPVAGQSFIDVKVVTVPNQSLSLREIIKRFIRNEALPLEKEGIYEERMGDLEKFAREDITVRHERAAAMKANVEALKDRLSRKAGESPPSTPPPLGDVTGGVVGGQAPPPSP